MTTKPKARKFRIRKASPLAGATPEAPAPASAPAANTTSSPRPGTKVAEAMASASPRTAPGPRGMAPRAGITKGGTQTATSHGAGTGAGRLASPSEVAAENDLAAIRKEGLTGRQLRMARRLAQKHGVPAKSDFDAVRQLRARGIDPFERANMLELVVPDASGPHAGGIQLPQTVARGQVPATDVETPPRSSRADEIRAIQRDIARRRRRRLALLGTRLLFFVALPTFLAGWYYYRIATPMYATKTEFVIQQADTGGGGALGGLFSGTGFATSQDSIAVQSYLMSRDAMIRLDDDVGFRETFSHPEIDPIQRLPADATRERTYDLYQQVVEIGYDPTEGIVKMEVIAPDPETSVEYSRRLIAYAEERVDNLTRRLRADQMSGAMDSFDQAESKMLDAQQRVLELQEKLGVLDPVAESGAIMSQIGTFETQLRQKQLERQSLLDNRRPNQARLSGVEGEIRRLRETVANLRGQMTEGSTDASSLAKVSAELRIAETELQTRTVLMQQALQQLETARIEANRQTRYLSLGVTPIAPDEASYPRSFENTLLAFLVFAGLYLLLSLTASILREQVSG